MIFTATIWFELGCLLVALFTIRRKTAAWWRRFIPFLLFTLVIEIGGYVSYFVLGKKNHWIYNIYLPIEIAFIAWVLYKLCSYYFACGRAIVIVYFLFLCIYFIESINSGFLGYSTYSNTFASVGICIICLMYFYYLLRAEEYIHLVKHPPFWVVSGLFLFYFGSTATNLFFNYLMTINQKSGIPIRYAIFVVLNFILYTCWSYAYLCWHRIKISSSLS